MLFLNPNRDRAGCSCVGLKTKEKEHWEIAKLTHNGMGEREEEKKMSVEQNVQRNIPHHIISHSATNEGKEGWGFVFLYVHCSETDWASICLWRGFFLCKSTHHLSYIDKLHFSHTSFFCFLSSYSVPCPVGASVMWTSGCRGVQFAGWGQHITI